MPPPTTDLNNNWTDKLRRVNSEAAGSHYLQWKDPHRGAGTAAASRSLVYWRLAYGYYSGSNCIIFTVSRSLRPYSMLLWLQFHIITNTNITHGLLIQVTVNDPKWPNQDTILLSISSSSCVLRFLHSAIICNQ